ncbi:MAG: hypothetical protein ACYC2I_11405 [Elusimicrobiales bacterium]
MAPENENGAAAPGGKPKARWGLTLLLLLVFLAGGGFYALNSMKDAAQRLAEDANQGELTDDSLYSSAGRDGGPRETVFAAQEAAPAARAPAGAALNPKLTPGWVKEIADERARTAASGGAGGGYGGGEGEQQAGVQSGGGASSGQAGGGSMGDKLRAMAGFKPSARASNTPPVGSKVEMQPGSVASNIVQVQKEAKAAAPRQAGKGGVMEALKGAFRASLYGARVASQDSAKSWVAKAFDASEEPTTAIEYDAKMKKELDVVNPNSIPKFLREQDVSAAEAKTLTAAKVSKPEVDKDGTKKALQEDKEYQAKNMAKQATDGVLNGLFSGVANNGSDDGEDYSADDPENPASQGQPPAGLMSLYNTDEYGNTIVPGENGMSYIFGPDGGILGCDDSNAGMCLIAGASDQCSADLTLSDFGGGM